MPNPSRRYFIGSPLFGLSIFTTGRGEYPLVPNPTDHVLSTERRPSGERFFWFGQRLCIAFEPRRLRPSSPLFIVE